jgi:hypothetical protein
MHHNRFYRHVNWPFVNSTQLSCHDCGVFIDIFSYNDNGDNSKN